MSLLRIYAPLGDAPLRCEWVLVDGRKPVPGEGTLAELPRGANRVQLVIPAAQVLLTRALLPPGARRRAGSVLAFAVEDATAVEPEASQVSWLGLVATGDADALAVVDKRALKRWRDALEAAGVRAYEVHAETLLLPHENGEWSLAWNGGEGFVRTGQFEGAATDGGDAASPPLSLRMMLDEAGLRGARPGAIAVHVTAPGAPPDREVMGSRARRAAAHGGSVGLAHGAGTRRHRSRPGASPLAPRSGGAGEPAARRPGSPARPLPSTALP